jgi:hypothetical protein
LFLPLPTAAQTTQTLSLDEGWNLVSLRVQPDDPSFASIFGGTDGAISSVKNEDGAAYLPALGIEQISTWRAGEGYKVHAEIATTIKIIGTELSPGSVAIALEEGGNIVPYLPDRAQAVEEAVMSIEESLVAVEDEDGRRYPSGSTPLDSLRPGQGYKVYVDRADTLRYPVVARTLDDALALTGMAVGSYVRIQGYHKPGDGGGGLFRVTDSGAEMDGATCFGFDADLTQTTEQFTNGLSDPSNTDLAWQGFQVRYGPDPEDVFPVKNMSGHNGQRQKDATPYIDRKNGEFQGGGWLPFSDYEQNVGYNNGGEYEVTYQYATSDRRLERIETLNGTNSVNLAWWGAPKANPNNPDDADPYLRWALVKARKLYDNGNYEWVYVDIPGTYYYLHTFQIPTGVKIRGTGSLNADGFTRGTLRLMPGQALYYRKSGYDRWSDSERWRVHGAGDTRVKPMPTTGYEAARIGYEALKVDGNARNNMDVFSNSGDYNAPFSHLQDSGAWTGFYSTGFGGSKYQDGMLFIWEDLHVTNMGASGMATNGRNGEIGTDVQTKGQVLIKDGIRNHVIYGATGTGLDNITLEGQGWGAFTTLADSRTKGPNEYTNLTVRNVEKGVFDYNNVIESRSGNLKIDGVNVDLSNSVKNEGGKRVDVFKFSDFANEVKNGTIRGFKDANYQTRGSRDLSFWFNQNTNGGRRTAPNLIKNLDLIDYGQWARLASGMYNTRFENVVLKQANGVSGSIKNPLKFETLGKGNSNLVDPSRANFLTFTDVKIRPPVGSDEFDNIIDVSGGSNSMPFDVYWSGGEINNNNDGQRFLSPPGGGGAEDLAPFRIFLDDVQFNTPDGGGGDFHDDLRPGAEVRLRNCTSPSGRESDQVNQSYTATSTDESNGYALIPTSLISRAWATSVSANAGYNVTGVEIANSDGTLRADDNSDQSDPYLKVSVDGTITQGDTFTWTARVTPLDDYRTTGLFTARQIADQSYTSGNGPFTVDLRGTASSQEDQTTQKTYTASSGNTSVVTASVQADGHTLELAEQGSGTATITITGEIQGVGTAQTTFEVTVE